MFSFIICLCGCQCFVAVDSREEDVAAANKEINDKEHEGKVEATAKKKFFKEVTEREASKTKEISKYEKGLLKV